MCFWKIFGHLAVMNAAAAVERDDRDKSVALADRLRDGQGTGGLMMILSISQWATPHVLLLPPSWSGGRAPAPASASTSAAKRREPRPQDPRVPATSVMFAVDWKHSLAGPLLTRCMTVCPSSPVLHRCVRASMRHTPSV